MGIQTSEVEALDKGFIVKRVLGSIKGIKEKPTVVFFGGIHGNEFAGVSALRTVYKELKEKSISLKGNFYAISGNTVALKEKKRFIDIDLNRIWTKEQLDEDSDILCSEFIERDSIYQTIKNIVTTEKGPFYFIDLHTTSAETQPFITISDSLNNRKFSKIFSIPTILGIEEYLDGPLLTYINEFGHIALGFEAGQHYKESSIELSIAFIWLTLEASGCIDKKEIKRYTFFKHYLSLFKNKQEFYEIDYKYQIDKNEQFTMLNGFANFETIQKNQRLAESNGNVIKSPLKGQIFMPLYQKQGDDGFFIITKVSRFWLNLSIIVRKLKLYHILRILPGIKEDKSNTYTLIVNPKTARFLAIEIFHLFGFRKKTIKNNCLYFTRRDRKISSF